jgi:hypothetical protein
MPVTRCACPTCRRTFGVPDDVMGKTATCPGCGASLVVKAMGGTTMLLLAGVCGSSPTQTYRPTSPALLPRPLPAPAKRRWGWGRRLVAAALFLVPLGGGLAALLCVLFGLPATPRPDSPRPDQAVPAPQAQHPDKAPAPVSSEDEKIAWRKLRQMHADEPVYVLAFTLPEQRWFVCTYLTPGREVNARWLEASYTKENDESPRELREAMKTAEEFVGRPDVKAAAVVDLFSGDEPRVLRWFQSDGRQAPERQLEDSLSAFFAELKRKAPQL